MTFIIAEAGVCHNGNLREAEKLIVAAKRSGADAVKFQLFDADKLKRPEIKHLEISQEDMYGLKQYADRQGIEFLCTPFDVESLEFLVGIGVRFIKIASGCLKNFPLLSAAHQSGLPIILSTGMCTLADVKSALGVLGWNVNLLHCTSSYPCPIDEVNLSAMDTLRKTFSLPVGYSDHTSGIVVAIAAVARGAKAIEKHLTLDRNAEGPDHKSSIEPKDFRIMVDAIRDIEKAIGTGEKRAQPSEAKTMEIWYP